MRIRYANLIQETENTRSGKHTEVEKVISHLFILQFCFVFCHGSALIVH